LWHKKFNDGFIVFEFQRSRYDFKRNSGFLNFGISFHLLIKIRAPKGEETWDLRGRLKNLETRPFVDVLFQIEMDFEEKEKLAKVLKRITLETIPYLERYSTRANLVDDLRDKQFDFARALTKVRIEG
jgi:hypothetical protein